MTALTIVFGFRDRDIQRVERCLTSLAQQTFRDFEVLFVDYGSQSAIANAVRKVVEQYDFGRYIYTETRGYPWNRSHALNIGGKQAAGEYLMTTDVDMIYATDFLDVFMAHADPKRELHIAPHLLPNGFSDWDNLATYRDKLDTGTQAMRGACQMIATQIFHEMRGYDEYYRYYGVEDRDMTTRLMLLDIQEMWLNDETALFHQWHPAANYNVRYFMPEGVWGRLNIYFENHQHESIRNDEAWGKLLTCANRPVLRFVDVDAQALLECDELHWLDLPPKKNQSIGDFCKHFNQELPSGHALAVNHAFFPKRTRQADFVLRLANRVLYRLSPDSRLDYAPNRLHNFIANFIEAPAPTVADYYLNLPVRNGVSVVVKA